MALVEVARFLDLTEAQTAASALRASDIQVFLQNENWGQTEAYLQLAMGGFRIWAPEEDAAAARAFIAACRAEPSEIAPQGGPAQAAAGVGLALLLGPAAGFIAAAFRRRGGRLAKDA
jgi:hypothetical protein